MGREEKKKIEHQLEAGMNGWKDSRGMPREKTIEMISQ